MIDFASLRDRIVLEAKDGSPLVWSRVTWFDPNPKHYQEPILEAQAHDGIDSIPADGTWNLRKGERVVTPETSAKLDRTLDDVAKNSGGGGGVRDVKIINNGQPATARMQMDGATMTLILDAVAADFNSSLGRNGRYSKAVEGTYGTRRIPK